jgi:hypothetical protein
MPMLIGEGKGDARRNPLAVRRAGIRGPGDE